MQHRVEDEGQDSLYQESSVVPALHCIFFVNHIYKFVGIYCSDPGSQFNRHRHVTFPHHIFDGADELVVKQQMLRFILGVGSRVEHPTHTAGHCSKMLLSCILREQSKAISSLSRIQFHLVFQSDRTQKEPNLWSMFSIAKAQDLKWGQRKLSHSLTITVWVPSLSASFSFLTSFCRQASERGAPPSCGFIALLRFKNTSGYWRFQPLRSKKTKIKHVKQL